VKNSIVVSSLVKRFIAAEYQLFRNTLFFGFFHLNAKQSSLHYLRTFGKTKNRPTIRPLNKAVLGLGEAATNAGSLS